MLCRVGVVSLLLAHLMFVSGCGGGGGSSSGDSPTATNPPATNPPAAPPFGLVERASVAAFNLPFSIASGLGSFRLINSFPSLNFPGAVFLAAVPGEDRLAVVQQSGVVRVFDPNAPGAGSTVILDLSGQVSFGGEEGLLGLAFDPDFLLNRFIYVHYSVAAPRRSIISRFTWDVTSNSASLAAERVILEVPQPFSNHNGGMLAFGPDNFLYIALGDGGSGGDPQNNAQNRTNLLGSMLRIDVHPQNPSDPYVIPSDNPFVGEGGGVREEIWAYGLRNPFRFSFDRQTGELWLGDVGQSGREEVNVIQRGGNYGWRVFEGTQSFDGSQNTLPNSAFTPPIFEYGRDQGVAVIGGYVYRGSAIDSLQGRYLYSDFGSGTVWALTNDGNGVVSNDELATANSPTSFGETRDGEVLLVTQSGGIFNLEEDDSGGSGSIPELLSQTNLFSDLSELTPSSGLIEYGVNQPFWSDGAIKRRWISVADNQQIAFQARDPWGFPPGTVMVKHFELLLVEGDPQSARRLETRVAVFSEAGWEGYTYRWNEAQTDARLLSGRETELIAVNLASGQVREQLYEYPSRANCLQCHVEATGFALGVKTQQLNRDFTYPAATDNQLRSFNNISLFDTDIGSVQGLPNFPALDDSGENVERRARTYLDVNCANCHQPGGPAPVSIDLRVDTALGDMGVVSEAPQAGDLGVSNAFIVAPGAKEASVLWERMRRLDASRMPPLSSHVVDELGVQVVGEWIDGL